MRDKKLMSSKKLEEKISEARWDLMISEIGAAYFHKADTLVIIDSTKEALSAIEYETERGKIMVGPAREAFEVMLDEGIETMRRRAHKFFTEGEKIYE